MEHLPNEIIAQIFSFIHPIYGDLLELKTICRKWCTVIDSTGHLWKHIHLDEDRDSISANQQKYETTLKICLCKYGHFVQCIRAEDQKFFVKAELRNLLVSLKSLRKLDIPVLTWSCMFANSLMSGPLLKYLTIDDCRKEMSSTDGRTARRYHNGFRSWDIRLLYRIFPNLEILCLHMSLHKLCKGNIVSLLDNLHLKELHLEVSPNSMTGMEEIRNLGLPPVREILASKHANILTSLEIRCLPVSVADIVAFTKGLQNLKHFIIGSISSMEEVPSVTSLNLESQSLKVLFMSSIPSSWIRTVKCDMPCLEVLMISECFDMTDLEIHATCLLSLVLRDNMSLQNIKAHCQSIDDLELRNCSEFQFESFKKLLHENPGISRIELEIEWESIVLDSQDCRDLRKLVIWEVDLVLSHLKIDCPNLKVFKCTGFRGARKGRRNLQFQGCTLEISSQHLKKVNISDVFHASQISIDCISIEEVNINGKSCALRPLELAIVAKARIDYISLNELRLKSVSILCPLVGHVMLQDCSLAMGNNKCRMSLKCDRLHALRVMRCNKVKRFAVKVPYVDNLTIDSCSRLSDLDLDMRRVGRVRVVNCPLLAPMTSY